MLTLALAALIVLVLLAAVTALAAGNIVPSTRLTDQARPISANDIKPPACAAYNLTSVVRCGSGHTCNGTNGNDLVLGSPSTNTINGKGGVNCCVGTPGTTYNNCDWHN